MTKTGEGPKENRGAILKRFPLFEFYQVKRLVEAYEME